MKLLYSLSFAIVCLPLVLAGCSGNATSKGTAADKGYEIKGKVVAVNADKSEVTLDHEDIPGVMKAMTMDFAVEDAKALKDLKAGDQVQGRIKKGGSGYIITHLEKR